jgi:hypothetical protein
MNRQVGPKHQGMCYTQKPEAVPTSHFTTNWNEVTCRVCLVNWVPDDRPFQSKEEYEDARKRLQILVDAGRRMLEMREANRTRELSANEKLQGITLEKRRVR